jgi:superfamily II DNA or RNA helicase
MPDPTRADDLFARLSSAAPRRLRLCAALHGREGDVRLAWTDAATQAHVAEAHVTYTEGAPRFWRVKWLVTRGAEKQELSSMVHRSSIRAHLKRLRDEFPVADADVSAVMSTAPNLLPLGGVDCVPVELPQAISPWLWLEREIGSRMEAQEASFDARARRSPQPDDSESVRQARQLLNMQRQFQASQVSANRKLRITLNYARACIELRWSEGLEGSPGPRLVVRCTGPDELTWELNTSGRIETDRSAIHRSSVRARLRKVQERFPVALSAISAVEIHADPHHPNQPASAGLGASFRRHAAWEWLEDEILHMGEDVRSSFDTLADLPGDLASGFADFLERERRREEKARQQREELRERIRQGQQRQREEQRRRQEERAARAAAQARAKPAAPEPPAPPRPAAPLPRVPVSLELPRLELQETFLPLNDLRGYLLRERAALWWVSNQSDDLLGLPYCDIQRLEYQIRTALRSIGPLRGRALLSDEVGLGKTIEAGLVLKEYLTRGMVKRFLVLTVPSLVDQWEEELSQKFHLETVTTNAFSARGDPDKFWRDNPAIIASLHTLKQPAHLAVAQTINWDMLIVDEAHYLRNRSSQAWQAVNALPRQFLLLLTATPVQNSLEELYNLVTLLQPGQLPSPREFRARFIDPKRPHQPREPEELRRLLGQVMIRNTRANAGIQLPPRRAETVLFEPAEPERVFWQQFERELRECLSKLSSSQASLWGRLLLQAAGSSPAAWRDALKSFPDHSAAQAWSERAPIDAGWKHKCQLLQPLTKGEGGVVIFTQFLHTQAALASELAAAGVSTFTIHGQTPAPERQPITEAFRQKGGALLLTHSGTEGRNLQFSHRLVNFDLPWNPMEIEQRIGRLHRLGQQHPVRIYNLVQAGTLQEHLLQILQEKLNLFELVIGETGLILGERFTSDEFAEEILRRWRESEGRVAEAMQSLGEELAAARQQYGEVKQLDETLFAKDYESL